jgi:hypothetical protein
MRCQELTIGQFVDTPKILPAPAQIQAYAEEIFDRIQGHYTPTFVSLIPVSGNTLTRKEANLNDKPLHGYYREPPRGYDAERDPMPPPDQIVRVPANFSSAFTSDFEDIVTRMVQQGESTPI